MAFRLVNREKLLAPRRCILCERTPNARVVDSGYNLIRGVPVQAHMRGRKYVCETCGEFVAKAFGYLNHHQAAEMKEEIILLQNRVEELTELADVAERVVKLQEFLTTGAGSKAVPDIHKWAEGVEDETPEAEVAEQDDSSA